MNGNEMTQIMQAIAAISQKINSINYNLNGDVVAKSNINKEAATDAQEALIELGAEMDERLSDIENALCEITKE